MNLFVCRIYEFLHVPTHAHTSDRHVLHKVSTFPFRVHMDGYSPALAPGHLMALCTKSQMVLFHCTQVKIKMQVFKHSEYCKLNIQYVLLLDWAELGWAGLD